MDACRLAAAEAEMSRTTTTMKMMMIDSGVALRRTRRISAGRSTAALYQLTERTAEWKYIRR